MLLYYSILKNKTMIPFYRVISIIICKKQLVNKILKKYEGVNITSKPFLK